MFLTLLKHSWLSLRRAHYFGRSVGIRLLMGFTLFIGGLYLYRFAGMLPRILMDAFPGMLPHETLFSVLPLIYISDLMMRYFAQGVPRHRIQPYLHLPLSRQMLARYLLTRSWFTPFNFYLLILFVPFFRQIIPHNFGQAAIWNILIVLWLLAAVNHALLVWLKTASRKSIPFLVAGLPALAGIAAYIFYPESIMGASRSLGQMMMDGQAFIFLLPLAVIAALQFLAMKNLSLYPRYKTTRVRLTGKDALGRWLARIPHYGLFWNLEWKLLSRNARSRNMLRQWPLMIPLILVGLIWLVPAENISTMFILLLMFSGSMGFYHLQYVYSWESHFFDFIATRHLDLDVFIRAKYYFYAGIALLQFLVMIPVILIMRPEWFLVFLSLTLYSIGPVYFLLFYTGVGHSTRMDPDKKAHLNFEGTSGSLFLTILLIYATFIPIAIIALMLPWSMFLSIQIITALTGLVFVACHPWWIRVTANLFHRKKYVNLKKYREQ